jgi:hypothetical protein
MGKISDKHHTQYSLKYNFRKKITALTILVNFHYFFCMYENLFILLHPNFKYSIFTNVMIAQTFFIEQRFFNIQNLDVRNNLLERERER